VTDAVQERATSRTNLFRKVSFLSVGPAVAVEVAAALPTNARRGSLAAQLGWALLIATTTTLSW
jgi:hypothetical protein